MAEQIRPRTDLRTDLPVPPCRPGWYNQWQRTDLGKYRDEPEFCRSVKVGDLKDSSLVPSKYIEFATRDEADDYGEKMTAFQAELRALFAEEAEARREVENVFRQLGYEL